MSRVRCSTSCITVITASREINVYSANNEINVYSANGHFVRGSKHHLVSAAELIGLSA